MDFFDAIPDERSNTQKLRILKNLKSVKEFDVDVPNFPNALDVFIAFIDQEDPLDLVKNMQDISNIFIDLSGNFFYANINNLELINFIFISDADLLFIVRKFCSIANFNLQCVLHHIAIDSLISDEILQEFFVFIRNVNQRTITIKDSGLNHLFQQFLQALLKQADHQRITFYIAFKDLDFVEQHLELIGSSLLLNIGYESGDYMDRLPVL